VTEANIDDYGRETPEQTLARLQTVVQTPSRRVLRRRSLQRRVAPTRRLLNGFWLPVAAVQLVAVLIGAGDARVLAGLSLVVLATAVFVIDKISGDDEPAPGRSDSVVAPGWYVRRPD
jgi:hypothetical protein